MPVVYLSKKSLSTSLLLIAFFAIASSQVAAQEKEAVTSIRQMNARLADEVRNEVSNLARSDKMQIERGRLI